MRSSGKEATDITLRLEKFWQGCVVDFLLI